MENNMEQDIEQYFSKRKTKKDRRNSELELLEQKYVLEILMYMRDHPVCMKSDLYEDISRSPTVKEKLDMLEATGMVSRRYVANTTAPIYALTDLGKAVTEKIGDILSIITGKEV